MSKVGMIESIQKISAELEPPHFADGEVLLEAYVGVDVSRSNHRTLRRTVAKLSRGCRRNECWVEPEQATRVCGLRITQQSIVAVGSRTRRTSSCGIASIKGEWETCVPGDDGVDRPVPDHSINYRRHIFTKLLAMSERQLINRIGADDVLGIPVALRPFGALVVQILEVWRSGRCLGRAAPGSEVAAVVRHALRVRVGDLCLQP